MLPDALLVNYKSLRFVFVAEPERARCASTSSRARRRWKSSTSCGSRTAPARRARAFRDLLKPTFEPARQRAIFSGQYPLSCGEKDLNVALLEPNDHVAGVMRQLWAESGGTWTGAVREGQAPPGARLLHTPRIAAARRDRARHQQVLQQHLARHLFLTLGAESAGPPGSAQKAVAAVKGWMAAKKMPAPELVMENGSGLSRTERISAATLPPCCRRPGAAR